MRFELPDSSDRKSWTLPAASGRYDDIELSYLDRDDENDRRYLIEAEHPAFKDALQTDREILVAGEPVNPRLHITMHEIVTNQLWADEPPEVWTTAQRLSQLGYERHVILHMIASLVSNDIWHLLRGESASVADDYAERLTALPAEWPPPDQVVAH